MDTVQRMVVLPKERIGEINPFLHGHFAEHLGELVYPGVYVGADSPIPNTGGIRNDVVAALKPLGIPVLRWPGGCFADTYHWRDGIGPRADRPMRVNVHWGMAEEPNQFGTHEFMEFCRLLGAEPYFAANLGSAAPEETRDWVEYCNFAGRSALADERRTNGATDPFRIKYWGVGNENWGCGGNLSPQEYAEQFARFRSFVFNYPGSNVKGIACGPNGWDWDWTEGVLSQLHKRDRLHMVQGFAAHYYCGTAGTATEYTNDQWLELLAKAAAVEGIITGHRALMDEFDPERKIPLFLDEWGAWHPVEKGKPGGGLYQQNTVRDACVAALSLDVFHNHCDKLFMTNIAQLINVLQALLLVENDRCITTPTFHVFDLYKTHQGGQAVRLVTASETISDGGASAQACRNCYRDKQPFALRAVQGSASVKNGILCVTAVNSHPTAALELDLEVHQNRLDTVEVVTLASDDLHAHNTFDEPHVVGLSAPVTLQVVGPTVRIPMPPGSIIRVTGKLAEA
jgi:alpha-N-arabinofuranosidase